jgi:hypothetical protein
MVKECVDIVLSTPPPAKLDVSGIIGRYRDDYRRLAEWASPAG